MATLLINLPHLYPKVDIAAGGWHSTALTDSGEVSAHSLSPLNAEGFSREKLISIEARAV